MERLQKVMAAAGVGSRRKCETLIQAGLVQVDGYTVTELGTRVDAKRARVTVRGRLLQRVTRHTYLMLHKPRGYLSDLGGKGHLHKTIAALLPKHKGRVFSVGRLDLKSEGLLLLTDDGELAHRLTHPRYEHPKVYYALVERRPAQQTIAMLQKGVALPEGMHSAPAEVEIVQRLPNILHLAPGPTRGIWLRMVLREGKKRQIRHMTAAVGHPTLRLIRWSIGSLTLGNLKSGLQRPLTAGEVAGLRQLVGLARPRATQQPRRGRS